MSTISGSATAVAAGAGASGTGGGASVGGASGAPASALVGGSVCSDVGDVVKLLGPPMLGFYRRPARARQPADHTTGAQRVSRRGAASVSAARSVSQVRPGSRRPAPGEAGLCKSWRWPIFRARLPGEYRQRCGVSLPCSGWERVVPPRSNHQDYLLSSVPARAASPCPRDRPPGSPRRATEQPSGGHGAERRGAGGPHAGDLGRKTGGAGAPPGHLFGSGRGIRTPDLRVMSPMSYRCSIPRRCATSIARAAALPGSAAAVVPAPAHGRTHERGSYDSWGTGEGSRMRLMKGQALDH